MFKHLLLVGLAASLLRGETQRTTTEHGLSATEAGIRRRPRDHRRLAPNHTRIVGRDSEIGEVVTLLGNRDVPLIALVGPPGAGKEAILREVASLPDLPPYSAGAGVAPYIEDGDDFDDIVAAVGREIPMHGVRRLPGS